MRSHGLNACRVGSRARSRVAFSFNKSIDAIVALFALIRTGATYVPLDPAWPAERCAIICEDADISLWVGTSAPSGIDRIKTAVASRAEKSAIPLSRASDHKPATISAATPQRDIANILFTSGSTGRPKGVEITTESLLHFSKWVIDEFGVVETTASPTMPRITSTCPHWISSPPSALAR